MMLVYHLRRRSNINPTLVQRLEFAGIGPLFPTWRYITLSGEHNLLSQHCFNVGQASQTANQHQTASGQHIMIAGNLHLSHHNNVITSMQLFN